MTAKTNTLTNAKTFYRRFLSSRSALLLFVAVVVACAGIALLMRSTAASYVLSAEAESGTRNGIAQTSSIAGSSAGAAVTFGSVTPPSNETPAIDQTTVVSGRERIWDLDFTPEGYIIFTERPGTIAISQNGQARTIVRVNDVAPKGEGGLMGMTLDPQFASNRYLYACFNTASDVRVARWKVAADYNSLQERQDIITGITNGPTGNHSGCRPRFGPDGYLWVGTGDAKVSGLMVSKTSLNGKLLRVDRNGAAAPGNLGQGFDARIYNYGHRNIQGLAFFASPRNGIPGITVEHGPLRDDEVNPIRLGNFGWDESSNPYDDNAPMTDKNKYPDAIDAIWSTGSPTQALSGAAIINGAQWKGWNGAIAIAALNHKHLKILRLDASAKVTREERLLEDTYGRLRTPVFGPDGRLYVATDGDKIIRLTPR